MSFPANVNFDVLASCSANGFEFLFDQVLEKERSTCQNEADAIANVAFGCLTYLITSYRKCYPTKVEADQKMDQRLTHLLKEHPRFLNGLKTACHTHKLPKTLQKCIDVESELNPQTSSNSISAAVSVITVASSEDQKLQEPSKYCGNQANCKNMKEVAMNCARCKKVFYCNKVCQTAHWKAEHKFTCKAPQK